MYSASEGREISGLATCGLDDFAPGGRTSLGKSSGSRSLADVVTPVDAKA